jgi:Ca2+-binding EF-hand superfamily protein
MAETGSEEVATQIQAVYRGHAQRRQTDKLKYDHNQKAVKDYLHQNNIPELMQHLLSLMTYHQPADPKAFMIEELTKIQTHKYADLVEDSDLTTMFEMIDVNKTEFISCGQIKNAMRNLGIPIPRVMSGIPETEKMDIKQWKQHIGANLDVLSGTRYAR